MENKLFTTVAIEDRHVGEPHVAFTENGVRYFGKIWLDNTRLKWYCEVDEDVQPYVTHVLEEVTLPSDEELTTMALGQYTIEDYHNDESGFIKEEVDRYKRIANSILNELR